MKRILPFALIFASMTLLFSCDDNKIKVTVNADLPETVEDYDEALLEDFVIEVDAEQTLALVDSRESFLLYIGNSSCSSCVAFKPALIEYIDKSKATVYHFDNLLNAMDYELLPEQYPDYFTADYAVTPSLYFFENGLMTARRYGSSRMMEYATLKPIMDGYMKVSTVENTRDVEGLSFIKNTDGFVFFYDRTVSLEKACFVDTIYPEVSTSSTVLTVADLDFMALNETEQTAFMETFGLEDPSGWLVHYVAGDIESSYQLSVENDAALDAWVTSRF